MSILLNALLQDDAGSRSVAPAGLRFAVYAVKAFPCRVCTVTMQPRLQWFDIVSRQPYRPFNRKASRAYLVRLEITVNRNEDREGTHRDNYPP